MRQPTRREGGCVSILAQGHHIIPRARSRSLSLPAWHSARFSVGQTCADPSCKCGL